MPLDSEESFDPWDLAQLKACGPRVAARCFMAASISAFVTLPSPSSSKASCNFSALRLIQIEMQVMKDESVDMIPKDIRGPAISHTVNFVFSACHVLSVQAGGRNSSLPSS